MFVERLPISPAVSVPLPWIVHLSVSDLEIGEYRL